jgi:hypothetical protein
MAIQRVPRPDDRKRSRRMPQVEGGGGGGPNLVYPDTIKTTDAPVHGSRLFSALDLSEVARHGSALPDTVKATDAFSQVIAGSWPDTIKTTDAGLAQLATWIVGRSGSPDADKWGDGWTDQASTGTNHGNESLLVKGKSTALNDERRAFIAIDLTHIAGSSRVAGATGDVNTFLTFIASTSSPLTATAVDPYYSTHASRPFTESTLNWSNQPAGGTLISRFNVQPGAAQSFNLTLSKTIIDDAIGKWLLIQFHGVSSVAPDTVTILSRDNATASNRPSLTSYFQIP